MHPYKECLEHLNIGPRSGLQMVYRNLASVKRMLFRVEYWTNIVPNGFEHSNTGQNVRSVFKWCEQFATVLRCKTQYHSYR